MLCDELWMLCVKVHQQEIRREVVRQDLQQRGQGGMSRRQRRWWRTLSHVLSGYGVRLYTLWKPHDLPQRDEPEALWERAHDLVMATARTVGASHHRPTE